MQAEFEKLKDASRGFVEKELELMGIPYSADMDDMTIKLRLMEARIVMAAPAAAGPAANASPYEKLVFEKPAIKAYVDRLYNKGDINGANIFMEYINDPQQAKNRYGKEADYQAVFAKADELMAAPAFTSAKLAYSGFPMMGEDGLRGQMESIGAVGGGLLRDRRGPRHGHDRHRRVRGRGRREDRGREVGRRGHGQRRDALAEVPVGCHLEKDRGVRYLSRLVGARA